MFEFMITELMLSGWNSLLDYLSAHVLLCLIPAFFIAGAFNVLISDKTIMKFMGAGNKRSHKILAYIIAASSGLFIEVCSCTILPLFAGVWKKGAGFGPAITFLYSGPGIALLSSLIAIPIFGQGFAAYRIAFSLINAILVGVIMELIFKTPKNPKDHIQDLVCEDVKLNKKRKPYQSIIFFISLIGIMLLGTAQIDESLKYSLMSIALISTVIAGQIFYEKRELKAWIKESFKFMKLIFPILLIGVFISGFIKPLISQEIVASLLGSNNFISNLIAVIFGAFAYFPVAVEIPIAKMFFDLGANKGPLMSYLLADPVVSLQTFLVINKILKLKKTVAYASLVIGLSVIAGWFYGVIAA